MILPFSTSLDLRTSTKNNNCLTTTKRPRRRSGLSPLADTYSTPILERYKKSFIPSSYKSTSSASSAKSHLTALESTPPPFAMPPPTTPPSRQSSDIISQSRHSTRRAETMAQSAGIPQRLRNDESWVEISSQPSSSSLSSIGDEIVTTGLRVQHDPNTRRRRRVPGMPITLQPRQTGTSSQEEYDESESDEDRVMTSSNEHISPPPRLSVSRPEYDAGSESDDDEENATALGRRTHVSETAFTPQPNAFSHPPSQRPAHPGSYFSPQRELRTDQSNYISRTTSRHSSHAADHDAALRASLTTLLSIGAAAARGLPKREQSGIGATTIPSTEPMGLRFVPESELNNPTIPANTGRPLTPSTRARSSPSISSQEAVEQGKRKAASAKPSGEKARALKKKRMQALEEETMISPTLMAWVMSAGAVVLISVVGFGAGYVIGREVGRQEVIAGFNGSSLGDSSSCGREAVRGSTGLRRFRWNLGGTGRGVVA